MEHPAENICNKIFRSATFEGMADEAGFPTKEYLELYTNLAKNDVKNIITGFAYISKEGRAVHPKQAGIDEDEKIEHFKKITDSVHKYNSKIYLQIAHSGRQTSSKVTGRTVVSSSSMKSKYFRSTAKQLTINEIYKIIDSFAEAAFRAKKSGFDGVQLHAAHGYLIHQFLHPHINKRSDIFGINKSTGIGDVFLRKIISSVREKCGMNFSVLVKISASDNLPIPFSQSNFVSLIKVLDEEKVDAIEISYGTMENALNIFRGDSIPVNSILKHNFHYKTRSKIIMKLWKFFAVTFLKKKVIGFTANYNLEYAVLGKKYTEIPIICVGGFRSFNNIKPIIQSSNIDYVSLCRPFICEPNLIKRFKTDEDYFSKCENCNICAVMCDSDSSVRCYRSKADVGG
jgi:2,4-dienoyl-CoA reductase-like NADH-dependent reductase (Old Yellow Enzyme family)